MPGAMDQVIEDLEACSVEELLATILHGGARSRTGAATRARDVAVDLLADLGGLGGLSRTTPDELKERLAGASASLEPTACARGLSAAFELGRRVAAAGAEPAAITNSADVAAWAVPRLGALDHEELWLLALDGRGRVRAVRCVAKGGLHGMGVRPADPLRIALRAAASGFVLVHNHPSGDPSPSHEDLVFTRRVAAAAAVVGVPLLDHVVVAAGGFASVPFEELDVEASTTAAA
ncbi:DNA repair protein RadC [soil metagenome]